MLRGAVGNYFKCLVYVFVALGCIMLGALFGLSVLWETLSAQAALLSGEIGELVPDAQTKVDELLVVLLSAVRKLDWSNAVDTILSTDWLSDLLAEFFRLSETASAELSARLGETLQEVSAALTAAVVLFALFVAFGVMLGYLVTNYFVRRVTVRRGFRRFWLYTVADAAISATIVAFTLFTSAIMAEIIRGGLNSVAKGQFEAAYSQGFNTFQTMTLIVLPQAIRNIVPTMLSQMITTIKDSSYMASLVTVELMGCTKFIISRANEYNGTWLDRFNRGTIHVTDVFVLFGFAFLVYFAINFTLSCIVRRIRARKSA